MQTSKERVLRAIEGREPDRIPMDFSFDKIHPGNRVLTKDIVKEYDSDFIIVACYDPEFVPKKEGYNQWGYRTVAAGETIGEVVEPPLENWENFEEWKASLPDFSVTRRYEEAKRIRKENPDKFLVGGLDFMMMEILNLRGYANAMMDYYDEEENLNALIDCLYEIGKQMVDGYAEAGMDAIMAWEDWGLQNAPMISYSLWMEFYYERMKDFVAYIHSKGMKYLLHSCGHITYLMDTFIEMGVDVIQMDQQKNMGLSTLEKWKGKICFWCPVDIQYSVHMPEKEMQDYIAEMVEKLGTPKGGFMYKPYSQPTAIHMEEAQLRREIEFMKNQSFPKE